MLHRRPDALADDRALGISAFEPPSDSDETVPVIAEEPDGGVRSVTEQATESHRVVIVIDRSAARRSRTAARARTGEPDAWMASTPSSGTQILRSSSTCPPLGSGRRRAAGSPVGGFLPRSWRPRRRITDG